MCFETKLARAARKLGSPGSVAPGEAVQPGSAAGLPWEGGGCREGSGGPGEGLRGGPSVEESEGTLRRGSAGCAIRSSCGTFLLDNQLLVQTLPVKP